MKIPALGVYPVIILLFSFAMPPLLWSDSLWDRAVRHFTTVKQVPYNVRIEEQLIGATGRIDYITTVDSNLNRTGDGRLIFMPHSGYTDGEEIGPVELAEMAEFLGEDNLTALPFITGHLQSMHVRAKHAFREINGRSCRRFAFSGRSGNHQVSGSVWLQVDSGLPLQVDWQLLDVPFVEEGTTVKSYTQVDHYAVTIDGAGLLQSSVAEITLEYMIFDKPYNGLLRRSTTFSDYRAPDDLPVSIVATTQQSPPDITFHGNLTAPSAR